MGTIDLNYEQAAGQMLIAGFFDAVEAPPKAVRDALAQSRLGGVILFRRNVSNLDQVSTLTQACHQAVPSHFPPPLMCLDQEGGRVVRLREPLTPIPPMRVVGEHATPDLAAKLSEIVANEVAALGFNVNFAPVLDVDTNPDNPVIGDRAFSSDPRRVAQYGGAWTLGHVISGVIPCGKHFPGHGDTSQDSHLALPTITHGKERLISTELLPFEHAIRTFIPMLMTAHIVTSSIDPIYPATLSEAVIDGVLRKSMGYDGVVVSDCLEMRAVADHFEIEEMIERGVRAGVDMFLICHTQEKWERAHRHMVKLALHDAEFARRMFESAARILKMKKECLSSWPKPWRPEPGWRDILGSPEHLATLAALQDRIPDASSPTGIDPTET